MVAGITKLIIQSAKAAVNTPAELVVRKLKKYKATDPLTPISVRAIVGMIDKDKNVRALIVNESTRLILISKKYISK